MVALGSSAARQKQQNLLVFRQKNECPETLAHYSRPIWNFIRVHTIFSQRNRWGQLLSEAPD
jgi:hypothetical protein